MKHLIDIFDLKKQDVEWIINQSIEEKEALKKNGNRKIKKILKNKTIAMIFEKPSTRTRVSFQVAINQLGGSSIIMNSSDIHLARGETVADTAKTLSRYVDAVVIRSFSHSLVREFSSFADVPVINALTNSSHPCQVLADVMTIDEHFGCYKDKKVVWIGDFNNVSKSWVEISSVLNIDLTICTPNKYSPDKSLKQYIDKSDTISLENDKEIALKNKDVVITDTWFSMGDKIGDREKFFRPYQVDQSAMSLASENAIFMHCLPAYRGKEVTSNVIDGSQSVVFDEAENRLHIQRTLLGWCLNND